MPIIIPTPRTSRTTGVSASAWRSLRQQQFAHARRALDDLFVLVRGDGCQPRRARQGIAAKRAAVRADKQRRLHAVAVGDRAHREPGAQTLGQADDVRLQVKMLEAKPRAGAPKPGLDLVDDQQGAMLAAEALRAFEEFRRAQVDAAFALHDLHDDGGDLVVERRLERAELVVGQVNHVEQGQKRLAVLLLPRQRHRADRAPVKGRAEGNIAGAACHQAGELEGAVDGLGAAVGQEDVLQMGGQHLDQLGGKAGAHVVVEEVGARDQRGACAAIAWLSAGWQWPSMATPCADVKSR